jgi:branched-chain amino acid transport system substrate-binding protein
MKWIFSLILMLSLTISSAVEYINVGAIFALTGPASINNKTKIKTLKIATSEINKTGGLLGKKINLIFYDNNSTALGSKLAAEKAVKDGVIAVIGASWSSHSLAIAPILQKNKIVEISPMSTNPKYTLIGDYIFRVCFNDIFQGKAIAKFVKKNLKAKRVIVFTNEGNSYSPTLSKSFINNFTKLGGVIIDERGYLEDVTDYKDLFKNFSKLNPDIVVLTGYERDAAFIIKRARDLGIKTIFVGGDGFSVNMRNYEKNGLNGNYFVAEWSKEFKTKESQDFINFMENRIQSKITSEMAVYYDSIEILFQAIKNAQSTDSTKIRDALYKMKSYKGVTGPITFDKNGDANKQIVILQFTPNGVKYITTISPNENN